MPVVGILIALLVVFAAGLFFLRAARSRTKTISAQRSQVPRLTGLPLTTARNLLRERGLVLH